MRWQQIGGAEDSHVHGPVAVTVEGSRLTRGTVPLVAAVGAVQLVVTPLLHGVTHRPPRKVTGCGRPLARHPAGKLVHAAAPAALLVLPRLGAVPLPITALLLGEAPTCRSATTALPGGAVGPNVEGGVEAVPL